MKTALILLPLLALLILAFAWAIYAWNSVDVEMSVHGYVAIVLGTSSRLRWAVGSWR